MVGRRSFPFGPAYFQWLCQTSREYPNLLGFIFSFLVTTGRSVSPPSSTDPNLSPPGEYPDIVILVKQTNSGSYYSFNKNSCSKGINRFNTSLVF